MRPARSDESIAETADVLADLEYGLDGIERLLAYSHSLAEHGATREICGEAGRMHGRLVELFDEVSQCRTDLMSAAGLLPDAAGG